MATQTVGATLREARQAKGLSLAGLVRQLDRQLGREITGEALRKYEKGEIAVERMPFGLLLDLLSVLEIPLEQIAAEFGVAHTSLNKVCCDVPAAIAA